MKKIFAITTAIITMLSLSSCGLQQKAEPTPEPTPVATPTATPRASLEYRVDPLKPNPNGDYYPEASAEFIDKINQIFAVNTDPQNTVFENVLGLYEYLTRNITYKEDGALDTSNVILNNTATKTGFTKTFQYLLNQIGLEAHIATSNDNSQSWVMAKMPDGFYHFDPAEDAKLTHGQSLLFFAMNDELRWDGGKLDGWYLGSDELGGKYDPPKNEKQTYVFLQNVSIGYGIDAENDCMYYADASQDSDIIKCNYMTGAEENLYGKKAGALVYFRGMLYFSDLTQRNQLFKMDVSNGQTELVDSVFVTRMMLKGDTMIYFDDISNSEKGIKLG